MLALDMRRFRRTGHLKPGAFAWRWSIDGESVGSVTVTIWDRMEAMTVSYTRGDDAQPVRLPVSLKWTPCRYGGRRAWFRCPQCSRACLVLYGLSSQGRFLCRRCMRLGYACEAESPLDRAWRQMNKIEALLTEEGRPKGMRRRTFEKLVAKLEAAEDRKDALWLTGFASLCAREGLNPDEVLKESSGE